MMVLTSTRFLAIEQTESSAREGRLFCLCSQRRRRRTAYQISKLCKSYAKSSSKWIVPRFAKLRDTLSHGADEIHMGPLGQLGPLDPQIGGLPALGVSRAIRQLLPSRAVPKSAEMFARYCSWH